MQLNNFWLEFNKQTKNDYDYIIIRSNSDVSLLDLNSQFIFVPLSVYTHDREFVSFDKYYLPIAYMTHTLDAIKYYSMSHASFYANNEYLNKSYQIFRLLQFQINSKCEYSTGFVSHRIGSTAQREKKTRKHARIHQMNSRIKWMETCVFIIWDFPIVLFSSSSSPPPFTICWIIINSFPTRSVIVSQQEICVKKCTCGVRANDQYRTGCHSNTFLREFLVGCDQWSSHSPSWCVIWLTKQIYE